MTHVWARIWEVWQWWREGFGSDEGRGLAVMRGGVWQWWGEGFGSDEGRGLAVMRGGVWQWWGEGFGSDEGRGLAVMRGGEEIFNVYDSACSYLFFYLGNSWSYLQTNWGVQWNWKHRRQIVHWSWIRWSQSRWSSSSCAKFSVVCPCWASTQKQNCWISAGRWRNLCNGLFRFFLFELISIYHIVPQMPKHRKSTPSYCLQCES